MTPLPGHPDTAVLPGRGTVTVVGRAVVVAPASPSHAMVQQLATADADADPGVVLTRIEGLVNASAGTGVAVASSAGWLVAAGPGAQVRADHVGHRSVHAGPVALRVTTATRLVLAAADASPEDLIPVGPTSQGTRSGSGVVIQVEEVLGTPAPSVEGVLCTCEAFVHPLSVHCAACGHVIGPSRRVIRQPGVPVGRIVLDDGRMMALAGTVVIGRDPASSPVPGTEGAASLVLADAQRSVSRSHVVMHVDGWDVVVRDNRAVNGTSVRPPSSGEWTLLVPDTAVKLLPGTEVRLGRRTLRLLS